VCVWRNRKRRNIIFTITSDIGGIDALIFYTYYSGVSRILLYSDVFDILFILTLHYRLTFEVCFFRCAFVRVLANPGFAVWIRICCSFFS
jgi:hypothetical protein